MLAHGFDAVDGDGTLRFVPRKGLATCDLATADMAVTEDINGFETVRAPEPEVSGRLRLTHVEAGADYGAATAEASLPESAQQTVSDSEFAMSLTRAEGRAIAERWLAEATISRDGARFALPPSLSHLGVGDVLRINDGNAQPRLWRLDRVERAAALTVDAVRVEPGVYRPALSNEDDMSIRRHVPPMPVWPVFLDLPLLKGDEDPCSPYLAATAQPWPGSVAAYVSVEEQGGYGFALRLDQPAAIGRTETALAAARPGVIDRGAPLRIRLKGQTLRSVSGKSLLAGANAVAIGMAVSRTGRSFSFGWRNRLAQTYGSCPSVCAGRPGPMASCPETGLRAVWSSCWMRRSSRSNWHPRRVARNASGVSVLHCVRPMMPAIGRVRLPQAGSVCGHMRPVIFGPRGDGSAGFAAHGSRGMAGTGLMSPLAKRARSICCA